MLSGKWARFVVNDLQGDMAELFVNAANGKYRNEDRWISRDDFFKMRDADAYVRVCWSFGNNGRSYLYGRGIEPYKRALHHAVVFGDFAPLSELCPEVVDSCRAALSGVEERGARRVEIGRAVVRWLKANGTPEMLLNNPLYRSSKFKGGRVDFLESLESLERLERLNMDYRDVPLPEGCVVYCDPPYAGTDGYGVKKDAFDSDTFWEWARKCERPLFISEYAAPPDFVCVREFSHLSSLSATACNKVVERLFVPPHQFTRGELSLFSF